LPQSIGPRFFNTHEVPGSFLSSAIRIRCHILILLLQEADQNARRTHHINVAREIAVKLRINYAFGREFQELTQGSRASPAYHGQVTLSRWPLSNCRIICFEEQTNFWRPHWFIPEVPPFQERIGGRLALVTDVKIGDRMVVAYNLFKTPERQYPYRGQAKTYPPEQRHRPHHAATAVNL
jgi:hypothetical protein